MTDKTSKPIPVVAAVMRDAEGRIFLARRKQLLDCGGLWEFPGGKIEPGETPQHALERELHEEFGIRSRCGAFVAAHIFEYPTKTIELAAYFVTVEADTFKPSDHDRIRWFAPNDIDPKTLAPADRLLLKTIVETMNREKKVP